MAGKRHSAEMDRRDFIHGRWPVGAEDRASASVEIASILVQARPERLDDVAQAIEAMPGTQIFSRDPRGKLVVVIEAAETGAIGSALNDISLMPHVLTAALVFHGTDEVEQDNKGDGHGSGQSGPP